MTTLTPPNSPSPRAPTVSSSTLATPQQKNLYEDACVESQKPSLVKEDDCELEAESEECSATSWDVACTVYLPLALLWMRRTISFAIQFVRALIFGHLIRFLLSHVTPWESNPAWLQPLAGPAGKVDTQSWPPPTLIALGALTIFFLVIHPDGTTWIILGKLRDFMLSLLGSSRSCWNVVLQDYGILPTIAAACTFLALFGLIWIVHRTLTPKTPPSKKLAMTPEKHKRKKRKGTHRSGRGGRQHSTPHRPHRSSNKPIPEDNTTEDPDQVVTKEEEMYPETIERKLEASDISHLDETQHMESNRLRTESRDTVTTDDQSCESASVRSCTSAPTPVTASLHSKRYQQMDGKPARGGSLYRRRDSGKLSKSDHEEKAKDTGERLARPTSPNPRVNLSSSMTTPSPSGRFAALAPMRSDPRRQMNRRPAGQNSNVKPFSTTDSPASTSSSSFFSSVPEARTPGYSSRGSGSFQNADRQVASPSLLLHGPVVPLSTPTNGQSTPRRTIGLPPGFENSARDKVQSLLTPGGSQNKGKMELAALLSQVGLGGNAREDLLEALDDVDALARLSDVQFELYNVPPAQKAQIELLLDLRRHSKASPLGSLIPARSNDSIPPPPGLELPSSSPSTELPVLTSPPRIAGLGSLALPSLESNGPYTTRQLGSQYQPVSHESSLHSFDEIHGSSNNDEDESSRIEAELQELGGQMVGSVLDF